jgi:cystathionine beta-lyase/cystathionine gamma-synthase
MEDRIILRRSITLAKNNLSNISIQTQISWIFSQTNENTMMGVCDALGITLEANSVNDLYIVIDETLDVLFRDLFKEGKLYEYLNKLGWNLY